jgi:hypothetical protein
MSMANYFDPFLDNNFDPLGMKKSALSFLSQSIAFPSHDEDV